jgi:hypothetical protein
MLVVGKCGKKAPGGQDNSQQPQYFILTLFLAKISLLSELLQIDGFFLFCQISWASSSSSSIF